MYKNVFVIFVFVIVVDVDDDVVDVDVDVVVVMDVYSFGCLLFNLLFGTNFKRL